VKIIINNIIMKEILSSTKRLALVIAVLTVLSLLTYTLIAAEPVSPEPISIDIDDPYSDGWEDGYCEGWKDVKGQYAYCPYAPYAPYATYNCPSGYKCGYNRGFKAGRKKALN
jgi:hypothetical protein